MIKYILFDLDGTLTNPKEGITKCVQHALRHFNIERTCDELIEFIGPPLKEQFMKYASLSEEDGEKAVKIYRERFAPIGIFENEIYDGIIEVMKALKDAGKVMAIATSKPTVFAQQIADKYGITPYIDALFGSELDGRNTDKALVIKNAMRALGTDKENTIMVGDREHDAIGAQKNGIECIGVTYGFAREGELQKSGVCALADSPYALLEILSAM